MAIDPTDVKVFLWNQETALRFKFHFDRNNQAFIERELAFRLDIDVNTLMLCAIHRNTFVPVSYYMLPRPRICPGGIVFAIPNNASAMKNARKRRLKPTEGQGS